MPPSEHSGPLAPIFLICSERSGSNLISTMMGEHPRVYAHPPYHMGRDLILKLREVGDDVAQSASLEVLVRHACQRISRYRGDGEAARLAEWVERQSEISPHSLARFVFQEMPLEAQGRHALVKENNIHHLLFFLVDCFPDARYLFQVRDPRDYLLSAKLRKRRWLGNKFGSLRNALQIWRDDQLGGLNALSLLGPGRVHLHRYEDLVARSEETLTDICEFLGLEFDAGMHDFHAGEGAQRVAGKKGGPRENVAKPLMTANFRKYRKGLSRGEIRVVEAYVGDLMDRFGYPREYARSLAPGWYTTMKPQFLEPLQRLVNGEMRPQYKEGNRRLNAELSKFEAPLCPPLWDDPAKGPST